MIKWCLFGLFTLANLLATDQVLLANIPPPENKQQNCPADLENLIDDLLKNLPSYVNRVIQRGRRLERGVYNYIIVAGKPEFKPIDLNQLQYTPVFPESTQQVFFTTLEREHGSGSYLTTQHYHWLFLTQTTRGWRLVMLFSRSSSTTPLRENSNSAIGEGIRLWLRDCRARNVINFNGLQ